MVPLEPGPPLSIMFHLKKTKRMVECIEIEIFQAQANQVTNWSLTPFKLRCPNMHCSAVFNVQMSYL